MKGVKMRMKTVGLVSWASSRGAGSQGRAVALAPLLRLAMDGHQVSAELYEGAWTDVGTPARLAELNQPLTN